MTNPTIPLQFHSAAPTSATLATFSWTDLESPEPLARGTTTQIYRATLHATSIAAKCLLPVQTLPLGAARTSAEKDLYNEALLNSILRHPHIVQCIGVLRSLPLTDKLDENDGLLNIHSGGGGISGLLFELAEGGCLVCEKFGAGKIRQGIMVCQGVAKALAWAHEGGVMHRDVKPSQVLMFGEGVGKLGDWGLAKAIGGGTMTGETGTWEFMAPEVIRSEKYGTAADVYSFGILLHCVVYGVGYPYADMYLTAVQAAMGVAKNGLRPKIKSAVNEGVVDLIKACWGDEPEERPSMIEVVGMLGDIRVNLEKKKDDGGGLYAWLWG